MPGRNNLIAQPNQRDEESELAEVRFRAMFDTAAVGIGILGLDRRLIDANPALCRMFGMNREDLIGRTPEIVTYRDDYPKSSHDFNDLLSRDGDFYEGERRYVRRNGDLFWAHVTMSVVRDSSGSPLFIVGMLVDIDEQKQALAELQKSEARLRAIFENASIGIALVGLDGRPLAVNPAILSMTGYTEQEIRSLTGLELSHPDDRAEASAPMRELIEGKRDAFQTESRFVRKGGQVYWVRQRISSVRGADGKPAYLVVMVEDISEQKRMLAAIQESEVRFRAMFDNVSVGMAMLSLDRRVLAINKTAQEIVGYKLDELINKDPVFLAYPEDRQIGSDQFREMVSGQRDGFQMEKRYVRKDGTVFWARITYSLVRSAEGQPQNLIGLIEDISEQKQAADQLAAQESEYLSTLEQRVEERTHELSEINLRLVNEIEQRQQAEESLASKAVEDAIAAERTRLARDLHDAVTQTLFSASLIAEVLPELWEVDPEEARKSNEELRQLTRGALAEMRTLLFELRPAALTQARFPDLLKQLSEAVIGRARLPVDLLVEGNYELPPDVKVAFYRIAQESLNNIVKYAHATQVQIHVSLDCCNVHLEIKDNGVGFDPASVKPDSLGMRIMRERAEAIHAHFLVSSVPDQGVTVTVNWNEDELIPIPSISTRIGRA
jgi:PAS domain S-box-containing protein